MANRRPDTVKNAFLIVLSILIVSGGLAYRFWPTAARKEASYVEDHLQHGAMIRFDEPMTVRGTPRSSPTNRDFAHCNVAVLSRAVVALYPEPDDQEIQLEYRANGEFADQEAACVDKSGISITRERLVEMLRAQYRSRRK